VAVSEQCQILLALGARGEVSARSAVLARLDAEDGEVRLAALQTLRELGEASDALRLAALAAVSSGPQRDAARAVLARLRGDEVDDRLLAALPGSDAPVRAELIRALAARRHRAALPEIAELSGDESEGVRLAVLEAMRELGSEADIAAAARLLGDEAEAVRNAAVDTVVALTVSLGEQSARVARIESLAGSARSPLARASIVRAVGRLGGPAALEFVRSATRSTDAEVRDAAVRALCDWPDFAALEDVLKYAHSSQDETCRVLALRGIVRLVGLPSERSAAETLALLDQAMSCATRVEDRKLVLAALGKVPDAAAVARAEDYLEDAELREEALAAALSSVRSLAALERESAASVLERLRGRPFGEDQSKKLEEAGRFLEDLEGRLTAWQFAGPYQQEGKSASELFDVVFAPEQHDAGVIWRVLPPDNAERPWVFDLSKNTMLVGEQRCVYVRTAVWSEKQQSARLELGSDDGVKGWLNGKVVHAHNAQRGHKTGEDKVSVVLERGWNVILLKITQADGGWAFSASLRPGDDARLPGLRYAPCPPDDEVEE
jgi:HEAT repeat protein